MGTKLKDMASVEMILNEMSLVEKASLVIGGSPMSSMAMEKYGIPSIWTSDCCNGLNIFQYTVEKTYRALEAAKKEKDFAKADAIRNELLEKGIVLEDTREGVKWKKA